MSNITRKNIERVWKKSQEQDDEEIYEKFWSSAEPEDFYFHVSSIGEPYISLVAIEDFEEQLKNNFEDGCWDQGMFLDHILPDDFELIAESEWSSPRTKQEVEKDLLTRGFKQSKAFSKMIIDDV